MRRHPCSSTARKLIAMAGIEPALEFLEKWEGMYVAGFANQIWSGYDIDHAGNKTKFRRTITVDANVAEALRNELRSMGVI